MLLEVPVVSLVDQPDRLVMTIPGLDKQTARRMANQAVREARRKMPKRSGASAARLGPTYGDGFFGVKWQDSYVWFQEHGISPFTMFSLAGKTIPMWVDDQDGSERAKNPKAQTRTTMSGKTQVLIFRRAAKLGQTKQVPASRTRRGHRRGEMVTVPASYPGAPGRISRREMASPMTTAGRVAGAVAVGNVGVRWRNPGLGARLFLNNAITLTAQWNGYLPVRVYACDARWRAMTGGQ